MAVLVNIDGYQMWIHLKEVEVSPHLIMLIKCGDTSTSDDDGEWVNISEFVMTVFFFKSDMVEKLTVM